VAAFRLAQKFFKKAFICTVNFTWPPVKTLDFLFLIFISFIKQSRLF
jgi:hypothetical protein